VRHAASVTLFACFLTSGACLFPNLGGLSGDAGGDDAQTIDAAPSCADAGFTCAGGDCCQSPLVEGGTFLRSNESTAPATLSDFRLDRFKVTVGRFRAFVGAGGGRATNPPAIGAGAHPGIPSSGWDPSWNAFLPATDADLGVQLVQCANPTWTDQPALQESLPITCITWYLAFAFCAWDGGRLATEAEQNYAAAGGSEQRVYPWSFPADAAVIDPTYANYGCTDAGLMCIDAVGAHSPRGDGRWGQADLVGSMLEWQLDWGAPNTYSVPCTDCALLIDVADAGMRSDRPLGGFSYPANLQYTYLRNSDPPASLTAARGMRCARSP